MKSLPILLVVLGLAVAIFGAFWYFDFGQYMKKTEEVPAVDTSTVRTDPPPTAVDKQTGEVNQNSFEKSQTVTKDDSIDTLETEVDNSVILDEDFSDL